MQVTDTNDSDVTDSVGRRCVCVEVQVKLTVQLVDFGLSSQEGLLRLLLFISHLLFQLLLSVFALKQL